MFAGEAINKAIEEFTNRLKSAGITCVKLDWWSNNDYPEMFIIFPNDLDKDGKPYINKDIDDRMYKFRLNLNKIDSVESAMTEISAKVKKYENDIYEEALCFDDGDPFFDGSFDAMFDKILKTLQYV